jgi:hypothetical protein
MHPAAINIAIQTFEHRYREERDLSALFALPALAFSTAITSAASVVDA